MVLFFEIFTFIFTGVLVWHSIRVRGKPFTLLFFVTGAVLGVVRENVVAHLTDLYSYNPDVFVLWVGAAPAILLVFWSFSIYVSMTLAERLVHGDFAAGERPVWIILVSTLFMAAYAASNEAMASVFPMVIWKLVPDVAIWGGAPLMVVFGYAGLGVIMLASVYIIHRRRWKTWVKAVVGAAATPVMIVLHLGWIALVRAAVKLFI